MGKSLTWVSRACEESDNRVFFMSNHSRAKNNNEIRRYEINVDPYSAEYTLFLVYEDARFDVIGRYMDFEMARLVADDHYQKTANLSETNKPTTH